MSCTPARRNSAPPHSTIIITSPPDSPMDQIPVRRSSKAYRIFPESPMESESESWPEEGDRERLPSILVEPSDVSEVESGELRWPSASQGADEDEDPFQESSQHPAENPAQEDVRTENGTGVRKKSIGPAQTQLDFSRLTPPSSPTNPEAAPPCLRS